MSKRLPRPARTARPVTVAPDPGRASAARRRLVAALATVFLVDALTSLVILACGNAYLLEQLRAKPSSPALALALALALTVYGIVKPPAAPFAGHVVDCARARPTLLTVGALDVAALIGWRGCGPRQQGSAPISCIA